MDGYEASTYGDRIADVYDDLYEQHDPGDAVGLLSDLAGAGPVLELGIGTGRIALPLRARGVEVHGVDASTAMVSRLREKPGGADIPVVIGDFADVPVEGSFSLIYVVFNTFFALLTQNDQVRCFSRVANHLLSGGRFLIEAFVPDVTRFDRGQRTHVTEVKPESATLNVDLHDQANQLVHSQKIILSEDSIDFFPVAIRYAYPAELDLMARLAGLDLEHRWGDWKCHPFTARSEQHVSIYRRPET
ncbi:MAG: methyltransferase domain-containing protein [Gammaproteobacteria bacterium]|nr:methyltransferase domain-containing protein [Gammaproteobacteria bacterium]